MSGDPYSAKVRELFAAPAHAGDIDDGEGLLVPFPDELGVIGDFQWLDPGTLSLEALVGLEGELNRCAGLSEAIEGFAVFAGRPVEIGSVDRIDVAFEKGSEFGAFE